MKNKTPSLYKAPEKQQLIIDPIFLLIGILIICFFFLIVGLIGASNYNILLVMAI